VDVLCCDPGFVLVESGAVDGEFGLEMKKKRLILPSDSSTAPEVTHLTVIGIVDDGKQ
jgi:hypothetical protein